MMKKYGEEQLSFFDIQAENPIIVNEPFADSFIVPKKLSGGQLVGGNSTTAKAEYDFYTTDPKTVRLFLNKFLEDGETLKGNIYECACGTGNISEVLKEYFPNNEVVSSDLIDRGYGIGSIDFLTYKYPEKVSNIFTNPPFSEINQFIKRGLELSKEKVIYLAKVQTLEGEARSKLLKNSPLKYVYVNTIRQPTWKNNQPLDDRGRKWSTTMCLCWFVWEKGYIGEPIIRFL